MHEKKNNCKKKVFFYITSHNFSGHVPQLFCGKCHNFLEHMPQLLWRVLCILWHILHYFMCHNFLGHVSQLLWCVSYFCGRYPSSCRGVPRNLKGGGRNFLFPFPLKTSVKTKKKFIASSDVLFPLFR